MNIKEYPKILLLCNFNQKSANGVTIKNLFRHWPKERIAVADYASTIEEMYVDNISKYYSIGNKESEYVSPINLFFEISISKDFDLYEETMIKSNEVFDNNNSKINNLISEFRLYLLKKAGLTINNRRFWVSKEFDKWFRSFDPDIVYTTMADISIMEFNIELKNKYKKKLMIHIFDDFINSKYEETFFKSYWKQKLKEVFIRLLAYSDLNMAISDKMSHEFQNKYGYKFYTFHNPVLEEIWMNSETNSFIKHNNDTFNFVFTGSVIDHIAPALKQVIIAINNLNSEGINTKVEIYTPTPYSDVYRLLGKEAIHCYKGFVRNCDIPNVLRNASGLILTLSFESKSIRYTRLSLATKATEYMVSKTPIFLFAPKEVAVYEYLNKFEAAYCLDNPNNLKESIKEFIENKELQKKISQNAYEVATSYHLSKKVTQRMYSLIKSIT